MKFRSLPALAYLQEALSYDPETGILRWLERPPHHFKDDKTRRTFNTSFAGKVAGYEVKGGLDIRISNISYRAHRIAYLMQTGIDPEGEIDHINGNGADNRFENLRVVSHAINARNRARNFNSSTPSHGVRFRNGMFEAYIKVDQKLYGLGCYRSCEEAMAARRGAEIVSGFHQNHGRRSRKSKA